MIPQMADDQLARGVGVAPADADGAEERSEPRIAFHDGVNALPQQEQESVTALIFLAHEWSAQLDRRPETGEELWIEIEQSTRVECPSFRATSARSAMAPRSMAACR